MFLTRKTPHPNLAKICNLRRVAAAAAAAAVAAPEAAAAEAAAAPEAAGEVAARAVAAAAAAGAAAAAVAVCHGAVAASVRLGPPPEVIVRAGLIWSTRQGGGICSVRRNRLSGARVFLRRT